MKIHAIAWAMGALGVALVPLWGCAEASDAPPPTGPGGSGGINTGGAGGQGGTAAAGGLEGGAGGQAGGASGGGGGAGGGGSGGEGGAVPDTCGNGTVEAPELCDGTDFDGKTCADFGLASGTLVCNAFCGIVLSGCTPLETCGDQVDNDGDGVADCQDDDCASEPLCTVPCFSTTTALVPGFEFGETTGAPDLLAPSCTLSSGPEVVLEVVAPQTGDLGIQLNSGTNLSLSVRQTCDVAGTELGCVNDAGAFGQEALNVPVTAGETYYVVLDGVTSSDVGWFDVFMDMVFPETSCEDFTDDDFDGFVDCDDPTSCKGTPQCAPGASATGAACGSNTSCAASGGDPACLPSFLGYSGGYCSEFCDLASDDCAGDAVCVDLGLSANGLCMDGCTTGADCRPGYVCTDQGYPSLVCAPPGELSCNDYQDNDFDNLTDCEDPTSCQGGPSCTLGPGAAGSPCLIHNQCGPVDGDPLCISEFQFGWPSGYCSEFCNFGPGECSAGSLCVNWFFFPSNAGTCFQTCVLQSECGPGLTCADVGLAESVCIF